MVKSLSALAIFSLLGASLMALPGIAYTVQAREVAVLAKGDRLQVRGGGELLKPGLAGFCGLVFAKHKSKRETSASALCERPALTSLNLFLGPDELDIS
jgi:hypothetical protein